jgi:integrase
VAGRAARATPRRAGRAALADLDLDHRQLVVVRARTTAGYQVFEGPPKSAASRRTVALDRHTVAVLREHARWRETSYLFPTRHGEPVLPGFLTHRVAALIASAGPQPVRLHDLRHGAATLRTWPAPT